MAQNNLSQFKYSAMSNLVLQADRRFVTRSHDEATGDPESLAGRISIKEMGARAAKTSTLPEKRKPKVPEVERGTIREGEDVLEREQRKRKRDGPLQTGFSLADLDVEGLTYRPRTAGTRATYDLILTMVARILGDVPAHITVSAADAVLETLKSDELRDFDKKKEIDDVLGTSMGSKEFNDLVNLGKKITDYDNQDDDEDVDAGDGPEDEVDERQGVAVVFDDESEDDDGIQRTAEVRDEEDTSDEEEDEFAVRHGAEEAAAAAGALGSNSEAEEDADGEIVFAPKPGGQASKSQTSDAIPARDIDAFWLQRQVGQIFSDAHDRQEKTQEAFSILGRTSEEGADDLLREIENDLMELFDYEHPELVKKLVVNKDKIFWVSKWRRTEGDEKARQQVENDMIAAGLRSILSEIFSPPEVQPATDDAAKKFQKSSAMDVDTPGDDVKMGDAERESGLRKGLQPKQVVNLANLVFDQGNHLMSNPKLELPKGSTKRTTKDWEEYHIPAPKKATQGPNAPKNLPTTVLPEWARIGFGSATELNPIQTRCFPAAFEDDGNMLVCAPTGSGKTNVAMLTMLREIGKHRDPTTGEISLDDFKIIYIAPLKALVQEQVGNFGARLAPYGIKVSELTGDRQLTKQQIAETQIIVTTPEKWDVITRKATDVSYTNLVRLICIDEIHLLHDDRGPVLESIVSRTIRKIEQTGEPVRIVGLSATLPNYTDVATFIQADQKTGVFHFDGSFRPCPLQQEFIGVTPKKPIKQLRAMNDCCYEKVMDQVGNKRNQMLIFVHSRKETAKTARFIKDRALEEGTITRILRSDSRVKEILAEEADRSGNADLKELMQYGFGIHHAGMTRLDRNTVEDLFADGAIQVLVCTATLAWGVNLPAHTVIIKGTQVYSPEKGSWVELSPQDVLQMLGRAGRPQFDSFGEGIILTTQSELQYYMSLMNQQLPIESQFISKLADNLNAEIVLGNVQNRDDAVEWLGYTYLFVRMLRSPGLYSVGAEYEDDHALEQKRVDLIHSAALVLEKCGLIKYNKDTAALTPTELGRIASHYYITHSSMLTYNAQIQPSISMIEMFRVFALSEEFKYIPVRQDEKLELAKLLGSVPIPVKEGVEEPQAKINVLLQAYVSRLKLDGLALMSDLVYVTQSAGRILRAIFEICLKKGWSAAAKIALDLCKTAEKRMWPTMSPLRQFPERSETGDVPAVSREIVQKAERVEVNWPNYFDLDPARLGELLGMPKAGRVVHRAVQHFPRLEVSAFAQPITRSMLKIQLTITPKFEWNDQLHGQAELFWVLVEDCDGEQILFHDMFLLRKAYVQTGEEEHIVDLTVPITDPMPPNYFVTVISDRWMQSETKIPVLFFDLHLPAKFPAHTQLLDLQPVQVSTLKNPEYENLYQDFRRFNKIQTQVFKSLFSTDENVLLAAPTGSGKTVCAEFALLNHWSKGDDAGKAVYIAPFQELVDLQFANWQTRFAEIGGGVDVVKLTGETTADLRLLNKANLVLATPAQWDSISRNWQKRRAVQEVRLFIADELHMLGGFGGATYESVVSRMQMIAAQLENGLRIVGLSVSLANARDLGEWIGANKHNIFNFSPGTRPKPLELHLQSFSIPHFPSLMLAMAKPTYQAIRQHAPDKSAMVFVSSRKQVRTTAMDLMQACYADRQNEEDTPFLHASVEDLAQVLGRISEKALEESIRNGIGYYHEALSTFDKQAVQYLFSRGAIQVMIVSRDCCWEIIVKAYLVVIMGTQFFEGKEHRYIDYPISEILQMFGKAGTAADDRAKGVLMMPSVKREYYKKFLNEALPIESQLQPHLHDVFAAEMSAGIIDSMQSALDWTTYTYFYRRLHANPSYYGLIGTSHEIMSSWLSNSVEATLKDLDEAKIIEFDRDDDSVTPLNPCLIASYYNISFETMQTLLLSLNPRTKIKTLLEIVASATEFETIQIRRHEARILRRIYDRLPAKLSPGSPMMNGDEVTPAFKAFVLLQAHFSRFQLPVDLLKDQEMILRKVLSLLSASVDILSSEGHLNAMRAMEVSQMVVQGMWDRDSPLMQIPHFGEHQIKACNEFGINDVFEFMEGMDPDENKDHDKLLKKLMLGQKQIQDAARFTNNKYPNVELQHEVLEADEIQAGEKALLDITIVRDPDEEEQDEGEVDLNVHAPFYPSTKTESWWLVVAEESSRSLLAIKRVNVARKLNMKLEFVVPTEGKHELTLYLVCDSYVGVDQAPTFSVDVKPGEPEDEEDDEEGEDEDEEMDSAE